MNDIEVSSIDLVEGGNVFKQGHYLTLGYVPRDEKGETVDLSGKTLNVSLWGRKGVVFEAAATYSGGVIRFTLDKMVPAGDYAVEFTVTSSTDAKYRKKFPTNQHSGRIAIKQSADDLGVVGIQVYTVAQLKAEQKALLDAAVSGFTVDSETKMARVSGTTTHPTIGARLEADKQVLTQQLAETALKSEVEATGKRIDELVIGSGSANAEVTDAHVSTTKNKTYTTLRSRIEETEKDMVENVVNKNLFVEDIVRWTNGTYNGNASTPVSIEPSTTRLNVKLEHPTVVRPGIPLQIYNADFAIYNIAIVGVTANDLKPFDSGWILTEKAQIVLPASVTKLYFSFRRLDNAALSVGALKLAKIKVEQAFNQTSFSLSPIDQVKEMDELKTSSNAIPAMFAENKVRYISHRGWYKAPENSFYSLEEAGRQKFWGCETDISETADGELVVMHDTTVDRTTNGTGTVISLTLAQIQALEIDAGSYMEFNTNKKVPLFRDFLQICKRYGMIPVIEVKNIINNAALVKLVNEIKKNGFEERCVVISFKFNQLEYIRSLSPKIYIQPLIQLNPTNVDRVVALGNAGVDTEYIDSEVTRANFEYAHERGVLVNVQTINDSSIRDLLIDRGADFISTDSLNDPTLETIT